MKTKITISFLFTILFLFGCSKHEELSRDTAEKLIREKNKFPTYEIVTLDVYDATFSQGITESYYKKLQNEGLLTYSECGGGMSRGLCATLTEKGQQFAVSAAYKTDNMWVQRMNVRGAKLDFGAITGILMQNESNTAEVQYQLIREVNPFGRILKRLSGGTINATAIFKRYDDGWRLN